jgi:hypothetical protein
MDIHQRVKQLKNLPLILAAIDRENYDFSLERDHISGLHLRIFKPEDKDILVSLDEEHLLVLLGIPDLAEGMGVIGDILSRMVGRDVTV